MTGFGRAEVSTPLGRLVLEMQSLNRKYLDIAIQLPKELATFETEVRAWVGEELFRGQISLRYILFMDMKAEASLPDAAFLKKLKAGWMKIAGELGLDKKSVDLHFLSGQMQKYALPLELKDLKKYEKILHECTKKALSAMIAMKMQEGKMLAQDIEKRIASMVKKIDAIEKAAPSASSRLQKKMMEKIQDLFPIQPDNEERVLREIVIYAEKLDITEELVRFRTHVKQLMQLLKKQQEEAIGRKMDFIIQELMREVNTIGSKSADSEISVHVVDIKSELEKVREQIQNIE